MRALLLLTVCTLIVLLPGPLLPSQTAPLAQVQMHPLLTLAEQQAPSWQPRGLSPQDLWDAYSLPSATSMSTATVVLVEAGHAPTLANDVAAYRSTFGLPSLRPGQLVQVSQRGHPTDLPETDADWAVETSLDAEMVSALCPTCTVVAVEADSATLSDLLVAEDYALSLHPAAASNSWGGDEPALPAKCPRWAQEYGGCFTQADFVALTALTFHHPGVAITVSSGDEGYKPEWPAVSPDVIAVGGTTLRRDPLSPRGWSESAWGHWGKDGKWQGSGSGCSAYFPKSPWQQDRCSRRTVADVGFIGDPATGVSVYDSTPFRGRKGLRSGWITVGGTSVGAPAIAALYGLANNARYMPSPAAFLYDHWHQLSPVVGGSNARPCRGCYAGGEYLRTAVPYYPGPAGLGTPHGLGAF